MNIKTRVLRFIFVSSAACLLATRLEAQVNWLTDNRSVTVTGYVQIPSLTVSNYSATASPPASWAALNGNISGAADLSANGQVAHGDSEAKQNSYTAGTQFNFSSLVTAATGGLGQNCTCYAEADSLCKISFSVNSLLTWSLAVDFDEHNGNLSANWDLISAQVGSILGSPIQNPNPGGPPLFYEGTLAPGDIYTLNISLSASQNALDPLGDSSAAGVSATFLIVPEPSASALVGTGLLGLAALHRRPSAKGQITF
jgi:hypothetical protein